MVKKINVLLVNDHLGWKSGNIHGVARWFLNTLPFIDKEKFRMIPCILRKKEKTFDKIFKKEGINIRYFSRGKYNVKTIIDFVNIIKKEKIHILHLQGFGSTGFGRIAGWLTNTPIVIHVHSFYNTVPIEVKISDLLFNSRDSKVVAVSKSVKKFCLEKRKMKHNKLEVLIYGIDMKKYTSAGLKQVEKLKKELKIASGNKIVGTVTRLFEQKGNKYLLMAIPKVLKENPDTTFVIVGDGPLRNELERMAMELGIVKNVVFAGFLDDVITAITMFDITVFPSLWEGTPLALLETMSIGKPIVSTKVDGLGEVLIDGVSALIVKPRQEEMISEKINLLLNDSEKRERLANAARKSCLEYSIENHAVRLEKMYQHVLEPKT